MHHLYNNRSKITVTGKYHYIFKDKKGNEISLVKFINYFGDGKDFYEIYGYGFDDIERYPTRKEAVNRIKTILESD